MLKISTFFDVIYWRTALWRLSLGYTSKLDANDTCRSLTSCYTHEDPYILWSGNTQRCILGQRPHVGVNPM